MAADKKTDAARVLVVGKSKELARSIVATLNPLGYELAYAPTAKMARKAVVNFDADIVLFTDKIGEGSAAQLIAELKAAHPRHQGIALSSLADSTQAVEALTAGADFYVPKPANLEQLADFFTVCLNRTNAPAAQAELDRLRIIAMLSADYCYAFRTESGGK